METNREALFSVRFGWSGELSRRGLDEVECIRWVLWVEFELLWERYGLSIPGDGGLKAIFIAGSEFLR